MDFALDETLTLVRDMARSYAEDEVMPRATAMDRAGAMDPVVLDKARELGLFGLTCPEAYGGAGMGNRALAIVLEEVNRACAATGVMISVHNSLLCSPIAKWGNEDQKRRFLPELASGARIGSYCLTEPNAGSDAASLRVSARVEGDHVVLNGTKRWCSGGGHADGYVVYCRLSDAPGPKGIGAVYVEKDNPGMRFGKPEHLMGFRGVPSCDLYFDNCEISIDDIVVPAGGFKQLMEAFDLERCGNATMALGQASGALEDVLPYVQERIQFGKPLVDFQAVQIKLAEMQIRIDAARLLIHRAAVNSQAGLPSILESSVAKCFANEIAREVCGHAVQLMGGYGYSREYPMERRLRDAWGWGIAGGAVDIQKVNIASAMVGRRFDQRR